jgi:hypothetical protein
MSSKIELDCSDPRRILDEQGLTWEHERARGISGRNHTLVCDGVGVYDSTSLATQQLLFSSKEPGAWSLQFILNNLATLHHEFDSLELRDIL